MKTERDIYLKPLTLREQVAMEQGICAGSIYAPTNNRGVEARGHEVGADYDFSTPVDNNNDGNSDFGISWE